MTPKASDQRLEPTQLRAKESRERVLASAAQLFADRGIENTSTNRIAAHAGMSIGSVYRYFADKDEIVTVLRSRLVIELEERFTAAVLGAMTAPPREAVVTSLRAIADTLSAQHGLVRALVSRTTVRGTELADLERRLLMLTRAYLLHRVGPCPDDELDVKASVMVTTGLAASFRIALGSASVDNDRVIEETATMIGLWLDAQHTDRAAIG